MSAITTSARQARAQDEPSKAECVDANEAGQVARKAGRLREAYKRFAGCQATSCPAAVRADCTEQLDQVDRELPEMAFDVRGPDDVQVEAVQVTLDDVALPASVGSAFVPMDPGTHRVSFRADGFEPLDKTIVARTGDKQRRLTVVLRPVRAPETVESLPAAQSGEHGAPAPGETPVRTDAFRGHAADESGGPPTASYVALGIGAAGLALGTVFGFMALDSKRSLDAECVGNACPPSAQGDIDAMHSHAVVANIGLGVGLLGVATAGATWLFLPREPAGRSDGPRAASPRLWSGPSGGGVQGRF